MWNVVQQVQIRSLRKGQAIADRDAQWELARHRERTEELEDDLAHLSRVCQAMWSILSEKLGVTEEELLHRVAQLDDDDVVVTQAASVSVRCPNCGSVVPPRSTRCQMCMADVGDAVKAALVGASGPAVGPGPSGEIGPPEPPAAPPGPPRPPGRTPLV